MEFAVYGGLELQPDYANHTVCTVILYIHSERGASRTAGFSAL
jgi:hypothetical protein